jgi:hypothetical protein
MTEMKGRRPPSSFPNDESTPSPTSPSIKNPDQLVVEEEREARQTSLEEGPKRSAA